MKHTGSDKNLSGVEAVALGLEDGGVAFATAYPGFHAHDMARLLGCSTFSVNEKNALAVAWGASLAGVRTATMFKNFGLNDAADAFVNACVLGVHAGMVLVVLDDVDVEQSQLRQDSRPYAAFPAALWLEPRSLADAYELARQAPALSERLETLVVLRVTNLLTHATGPIRRKPPVYARRAFCRAPERWVVHPINAAGQQLRLAERQEAVARWVDTAYPSPVIAEGQAMQVAVGMAVSLGATPPDLEVFTLPLPRPWLRAMVTGTTVIRVEEHGTSYAAGLIATAIGEARVERRPVSSPGSVHHYRSFDRYESLYAVLRGVENRVVVGDLGGHTMDPSRTVDACLCYGCSVGVATGLAAADPALCVFCVTGDAAFLHSGKTALAEARTRHAPITVLVLDNGGSQGTGGQVLPGSCEPERAELEWYDLGFTEAATGSLKALLTRAPNTVGPTVIRIRTPF